MNNLVEELSWRGMIHDIMPGTEEQLMKEMTAAYVGFDPTADSLHIGNMVPIMLLVHLQRCGHKPIALVGGATGMVGDPSGKSAERQLLSIEDIQHNLDCQRKQLEQFLDFDCGENSAEVVNNYDWFKEMNFLDFIRDAGKHITINYMLAKDSVKSRLDTGMSFTEFSYQLIQGFDFYWLYAHKGVKLQMGGSDQWGNITTGTEFIRRKAGGEAFALTAPLIKKADGSKFGKSEGGNVWLDPEKTSPYKFYQYWINSSDEDAEKYIRVFTLLDKESIEALEAEHTEAPHQRVLQKRLAEEVTTMVHGKEALESAIAASQLLFKGGLEDLKKVDEQTFLSVFEGVPQAEVPRIQLDSGLSIIDALAGETGFLKSNGEARRALKENSISVNKEKVDDGKMLDADDLLNERYILLQRGKKNYYLLKVE
ncbi:MAG: tyrosine--tRNA ligase [Flavobacteriales bacterium]|nr:tyrosine--tRNA ligase [Flavobacteriales bacterium]